MKCSIEIAIVAAIVSSASVAFADGTAGSLTRLDRTAKPEPAPKKSGKAQRSWDENNLIDRDDRIVASYDRGMDPNAFALFGACTATHLGRGVFLTAGHCVDDHLGLQGFRSSPCPHPLRLRGLSESADCNVIIFRYDKKTDYALLELGEPSQADDLPSVPVDYGIEWRRLLKRKVRSFGYSEGVLRENQNCSARIETARDRLVHDCDTQGGDSGSALIDQTSQHIVGVHAGGLKGGQNYGYPIDHVPWAESLCVAVAALEQQQLSGGGVPATLRLSTSHLTVPFQRMMIQLSGKMSKNRLRVRLIAPEADMVIDNAWLRWNASGGFNLKEVFVLDQHRAGPWAVEVSALGNAQQRKGFVDGRVWVCP